MRGQAYVPTRWWLERNFIALRPDAQRVLLALWTAPEMPITGIAALAVSTLSDRLRIDGPVVNCRLIELQDAEFVTVDPDAFLVWLHGYIDVQLGGAPASNPKWLRATARALANLPQTRMVARFRDQYRIPDSLSIANPDRPSHGVSHGVSHRSTIDTSLSLHTPRGAPAPSTDFPAVAQTDEVAK